MVAPVAAQGEERHLHPAVGPLVRDVGVERLVPPVSGADGVRAGVRACVHPPGVLADRGGVLGHVVEEPVAQQGEPALQQRLRQAPDLVEGEPPQVGACRVPVARVDVLVRPGQEAEGGPAPVGVGDVQEADPAGGLREEGGVGVGDHGADVVARDAEAGQPQVFGERLDVVRHGPLVVAPVGFGRGAHAAQVHGDHPAAARRCGHHLVPLPPGLRPAAQQEQGLAVPAAGDVVQPDAVDVRVVAGEAAVE